MGLRRSVGSIAVSIVLTLAVAQVASAAATRVYSVSLTVTVDQVTHRISGTILTKAPSELCDSSKVRIRKVMPGKDEVVARVKPSGGEWQIKLPAALRGSRVYAEVSRYRLPGRPVECREARSPTVTAP